MRISNRSLTKVLVVSFVSLLLIPSQGLANTTTIQVYKTPTCGCCTKWIDHLREAGFTVDVTELSTLNALKAINGVPANLASCHTAIVEGYVIEGHVPASDVERLLKERPAVAGLAVPGMPTGSPGMEHADPTRHEAYDVVSFGARGEKIFSRHKPSSTRVRSPE